MAEWGWRSLIAQIIKNKAHDRSILQYWRSFRGWRCSTANRFLEMALKRISKQIDTIQMMAESRTEIMLPVGQSCPKTGREIAKWSVWKTLLETATPTGVRQGSSRFKNRLQAMWTTNKASWAQSCRGNMISKSWNKSRWLFKSSKTRKWLYLRETFRRKEDLVPSNSHKASISKTSKSHTTPDKVLWDMWNMNLVPKQAMNNIRPNQLPTESL